MNKIRRMLTVTGQRLNLAGIALVNPDLYGTGDSEGEFRDASWSQWLEDLRSSLAWANEAGLQVRGLLGVRTGALLAAEFAAKVASVRASVLWQPVQNGRSFLNQFLRVRVVSNSVNKGVRETVESLMDQIDSGKVLRVSGYELTQTVASPLSQGNLDSLATSALGNAVSIDVKRTGSETLEQTTKCGSITLTQFALKGEPYWNSVETLCNERVVELTSQAFERNMVHD